jgi:hypothetical protein
MARSDDVLKGLRRGDAEIAVHALRRLPPEERAELLEPVGALFRAAVAADHRAKDWSRLTAWASRAEKLPGLEGAPGSAGFVATHWSLTWGALKTKELERARRWYEPLHPVLVERSPGFATAMAALVAGAVTPAQVAPFLAEAPPGDPRLGYEPRRQRREWSPPTSVEEAEGRTLALAGTEPWAVFAATLTAWTSKLEPRLVRPMLELAAPLAVREALNRLTSSHAQPLAPAELLRLAVETLGAPASLAGDAELMFRLAAMQVPPAPEASAPLRELTHAAVAAGAYEALRPLVVAKVTALEPRPQAAEPVLRLVERLLARRVEVALVGKALRLLSLGDPARPDEHRPAPVIVGALAQALSTEASALASWFNGLPDPERGNLSQWAAFVLPVEVVQSFTVVLWPLVSEAARGHLCALVGSVLYRLSDDAVLEEALDESGPPSRVPPRGRQFWSAVRELVLPEAPEYLPLALRAAAGDAGAGGAAVEQLALIERALGPSPAVGHVLEVWAALWWDRRVAFANRVERRLFERFGGDARALAQGVLIAHRLELPLGLKRRLAEPLLTLCKAPGAEPVPGPVLKLALQWTATAGRPRKPAAGPKPAQRKKKAKPTPPPENGSLPL